MTAADPIRDGLHVLSGRAALSALCGLGLLMLALVVRQLLGASRTAFPYERQGPLFSAAERAFLAALGRAAGEDMLIFGKVRVADILRPRGGLPRPQFLQALNRVTSKHVDFVLCDPDSHEVIAAVELDDRSHAGRGARVRDGFKDGAFAAAGVPLLRVPARRTYDVAALREQLDALPRPAGPVPAAGRRR